MKNIHVIALAFCLALTGKAYADSATPACLGESIAPEVQGEYEYQVVNAKHHGPQAIKLDSNSLSSDFEGKHQSYKAWTCLKDNALVLVLDFGPGHDERYESAFIAISGNYLISFQEIFPSDEPLANFESLLKSGKQYVMIRKH